MNTNINKLERISSKKKQREPKFFPIFRQSLRISVFLLVDASIPFSSFRYISFKIDEFEVEDFESFQLFLKEWLA